MLKLFEQIETITKILTERVKAVSFYREYDVVGISRLLKEPVTVISGAYEETEGCAVGKITMAMYIPQEMSVKAAQNIFCNIFEVIREQLPPVKSITMEKVKKDNGIPVINCSFSLWDTGSCSFYVNGVTVSCAGINVTEKNQVNIVGGVGSGNSNFTVGSKKHYEGEIIGADLDGLDGLKQFTLTYENNKYMGCVWKSLSYDSNGFVRKAVFTAPIKERK